MTTLVKSLTNRDHRNVDDMGVIMGVMVVVMGLLWTIS